MIKNKILLPQIFEKSVSYGLERVQVSQFMAKNSLIMRLHWAEKKDNKWAFFHHESDDVLDLVDALDAIYMPELMADEANQAKIGENQFDELCIKDEEDELEELL